MLIATDTPELETHTGSRARARILDHGGQLGSVSSAECSGVYSVLFWRFWRTLFFLFWRTPCGVLRSLPRFVGTMAARPVGLEEGAMPVYCDYNAGTPVDPEVAAVMEPYLVGPWHANPSSGYPAAVHVKAALETARAQVASLIGAHADEVVFTSGGTEAINMALLGVVRGIMRTAAPAGGLHVITTVVEHVAVLRTLDHLTQELGIEVTRLPVDAEGRVTASQVVAALRDNTRLVTIMHANNEVQ